MESHGGVVLNDHSKTEETLKSSVEKNPAIKYKILTLVFCGLTGMSAFGLFGGSLWMLYDLEYFALIDQMNMIGYIYSGFALASITLNLIFKKNMYVFVILSFSTATFGSFQLIIFAISPFREGLFGHYQYVISFVLSLILLVFTYVYVVESKNRNLKK